MECFGTTDFDNNSRLITLSAIIISGLHCTSTKAYHLSPKVNEHWKTNTGRVYTCEEVQYQEIYVRIKFFSFCFVFQKLDQAPHSNGSWAVRCPVAAFSLHASCGCITMTPCAKDPPPLPLLPPIFKMRCTK